MTRPASRLFPHTVTRRRYGAAGYTDYGKYEVGAPIETDFRASVEPLKLEDIDTVGGAQLSDQIRVYIPEPDALAAAHDDKPADRVVFDGDEYTVVQSQSWIESHTAAILLREV